VDERSYGPVINDPSKAVAAPGNRVAILAAHEPDLDPRIDWIAGFAPDSVSPIVFGIFDARRSRPQIEVRRNRYTVKRVHKERSTRRESIIWLMELIRSRGFFDFLKLLVLLAFGMAVECPMMLLWVPVVLVRRTYKFLERRLIGWMLESKDTKYAAFRRAYIPTRKRLRSVLEFLFDLRQKYQFRPNRLMILAEVAQYFYATTNALKTSVRADGGAFSVIHANDLETLFASVELKGELQAKLIYDAHEFWPHSDVAARWWEVLFWETVERNLVQDVDLAFTVSAQLAEIMGRRYSVKFETLPNSEPYDSAALQNVESNALPLTFVFQGGFAAKRGIDLLLRAWAEANLSDSKLILRGPDSETKDRCIELAHSLGLSETVTFAPSVEEGELLSSLRGCAVGIIPYEPYGLNYKFCCPNKLSQYMKCGLAVLHNKLPYIEQVVHRAKAGWQYDSSDIGETAKQLREIARNRAQIAEFGRNARHYFDNSYNWQVVSRQLYEGYRL
jgi:glycosyltransferase involved in cell wall biosynthesis